MNKIKKEKKVYLPTDIISFPVYMPFAKYQSFSKLCTDKRMPMTKIAEAEIDKFIKRETI